MAFIGMTDRFEKRMDDIYGKYSLRGPGGVGAPFLELKPNDPKRDDTRHDSRFSPGESGRLDQQRIASFLKSPAGLQFMLDQAELQAANTFSETRIYNPVFLFGKVAPNWIRIRRPLGTAQGIDVGSPDVRSPGADAKVGGAGRLQIASSRTAVNNVLNRTGPTGLLNLLPSNSITRIASAVKGILDTGILKVNDRPELNLDGQYFSIAMWTGFSRTRTEPNSFTKAASSLRKGDIKGALSSLGKGIVNQLKNSIIGTKGTPIPNSAREDRNQPSRSDLSGLRYFIVNKTDADRYLQNSVIENTLPDGTIVSKPTVEYLHRLPLNMVGGGTSSTSLKKNPSQLAAQVQSKKKSLLSKIGGFLKGVASSLIGGNSLASSIINIGPTNQTTGRLQTGALSTNPFATNPAEERMLFGELSLASRYEDADGDVKFFKDGISDQKDTWLSGIRALRTDPTYGVGYIGGISPGNAIVDDQGIFAAKKYKVDNQRYFSDRSVDIDAIIHNPTPSDSNSKPIDPSLKEQLRGVYKNTIDFMFHDYVNNKIIPFRAMLSQINENVNAEFDEQRYIGRIEKNVIYVGVARTLSFTFFIQAFSKDELNHIWAKINYLTGMCFPADYSNGFMVPPFVQLTMGNYYVDQPGYIKDITYTIEDNVSWDIDTDAQLPMGVTVSVNFAVIEKQQVSTGKSLYGELVQTNTVQSQGTLTTGIASIPGIGNLLNLFGSN